MAPGQIHGHLLVLVQGVYELFIFIITQYLGVLQPIFAVFIDSKTLKMNFPTSFD